MLLGFAQAVELAAQDLYQVSLDAGVDEPVMHAMREQPPGLRPGHRRACSALDAPGPPDEAIVAELRARSRAPTSTAVAAAGHDLESTLVATHTELLGLLEGIDGPTSSASIVIVEARHCAVLADMAGLGDDIDALFVNDAEPSP